MLERVLGLQGLVQLSSSWGRNGNICGLRVLLCLRKTTTCRCMCCDGITCQSKAEKFLQLWKRGDTCKPHWNSAVVCFKTGKWSCHFLAQQFQKLSIANKINLDFFGLPCKVCHKPGSTYLSGFMTHSPLPKPHYFHCSLNRDTHTVVLLRQC